MIAMMMLSMVHTSAPMTVMAETPVSVQMWARKFDLDGHQYIYFLEDCEGGYRGVIHDPGCECYDDDDYNKNKDVEYMLCTRAR